MKVFFSMRNPLLNWNLPFFQRLWYSYAAWAPITTVITVPGERGDNNAAHKQCAQMPLYTLFQLAKINQCRRCQPVLRSKLERLIHFQLKFGSHAPSCLPCTAFMIVPFMSIIFGVNPVTITSNFVLASTLYFPAMAVGVRGGTLSEIGL